MRRKTKQSTCDGDAAAAKPTSGIRFGCVQAPGFRVEGSGACRLLGPRGVAVYAYGDDTVPCMHMVYAVYAYGDMPPWVLGALPYAVYAYGV